MVAESAHKKHGEHTSKTSKRRIKPPFDLTWEMAIAIVVLLGAVSYLLLDQIRMSRDITKLQQQSDQRVGDLEADINALQTEQRPALAYKENKLVIPELKITLPYNDITKSLRYSYDEQDNDQNARVTSSLVGQQPEQQLSCNELVRLSFRNAIPYNPWEEKAGDIKLTDGRTLHIIAAKAFANNEASTEGCVDIAWARITPQQVAAELRKAESY